MMRPIVSALLIATIAIVCGKAASAQTPADIVLLSGKVITVDDRFTIAEALAIKGERILAVGSNAEVEKHKGPLTRVVDLNRRTVIPGLIDNHSASRRSTTIGSAAERALFPTAPSRRRLFPGHCPPKLLKSCREWP